MIATNSNSFIGGYSFLSLRVCRLKYNSNRDSVIGMHVIKKRSFPLPPPNRAPRTEERINPVDDIDWLIPINFPWSFGDPFIEIKYIIIGQEIAAPIKARQ